MDFEFEAIMDWWDENKEWMLIPVGVTIAIVIIGFILLLITGADVNVLIKTIFILLLFSSPFIGFYLGDYIDPYLEPLFAKIKQ